MNTFTRELQKILDLVVSLLTDGVARVASPSLILSDEPTASTDGKVHIVMPRTFLGKDITEQLVCAIGLLAHEFGHWLQPLAKIDEIEKQTGLDHDIVNILLDIQLEENVAHIMPLFKHNLEQLRSAIGKAHKKDYEQKQQQSGTFLEAALYTLLYGRFCHDITVSFKCSKINVSTLQKFAKLQSFIYDASVFAMLKSSDLPEKIREIAVNYPELCNQNRRSRNGLQNPTDMISSTNLEALARLINAIISVYDGAGDCESTVATLRGHELACPEVLAISRSIQKRWEVPRVSGSILGPGRMNRLAAVRGDPIPFEVRSLKGRSYPETNVVLAADHSGSMEGARWSETLKAAQAITIAIRNTGGDVRGAIFEGGLVHTRDFDAGIFFSSAIGSRSMHLADGNLTSFGWLPLVWQTFPRHRIVLLTDGNGFYPPVVPQSCRRRTSAILLQVDAVSERCRVEDTVRRFAERLVHVNRLDEIVSAWAIVIPRLAQ
jgi:hypothetical protein